MRSKLPIIVIAQFFCTSLWFAGNAISPEIVSELNLKSNYLAHLTSVIQFGFIAGTLLFAIFSVSDKYSPSLVFCVSSVLAGVFNLGISISSLDSAGILVFRFLTGFFLAGIYPVGMKIASDYYDKGLGKSLGFLVGALVLGTSFPHLLKNFISDFPWRYIIYATTLLSFIGGLGIYIFVPDGPHRRRGQKIKLKEFIHIFKNKNFRSVSFGYFGHMWELYTFWAFVPVMLSAYNFQKPTINLNVSFTSFLIIASGALSCIIGGQLSGYFGAKKVATWSLFLSCTCCLISPLFLSSSSPTFFILFLFVWGLVVIADSPLFSTLVAQNAPLETRGTALTIVNCIGFAITIISIQFISFLSGFVDSQYVYLPLAIGPMLGLIVLLKGRTER